MKALAITAITPTENRQVNHTAQNPAAAYASPKMPKGSLGWKNKLQEGGARKPRGSLKINRPDGIEASARPFFERRATPRFERYAPAITLKARQYDGNDWSGAIAGVGYAALALAAGRSLASTSA
jgi:hypothetical protein